MEKNYDVLKLENQICFPLYVVSKEVIKKYKPYLDALGLTYTQYITMMVMWEKITPEILFATGDKILSIRLSKFINQ